MSQSSISFRTILSTIMKFLVLLIAAFAISTASPLDPDEGFLCGVCQIMVGTAENLLIGGHTEDEIIADMDKVKLLHSNLIRRFFRMTFGFLQFCTDDLDPLVPNIGLGKTCTEFVDKYLHSAIDKLLQDLTPKEVCQDLTLC